MSAGSEIVSGSELPRSPSENEGQSPASETSVQGRLRRRLARSTAIIAVIALLAWGASELWPRKLLISENELVSQTPPKSFELSSQLSLRMDVKLSSLSDFLNAEVDKAFSGSADDPTNWLTRDHVEWRLERGPINFSAGPNGAIIFSCAITSGSATIKGRLGVKRRNKGPLGWFEELIGVSFQETANFKGTITGSVSPILAPDWTVNPQLRVHLDLTKADADLFGKALRISFRDKAEQSVNAKLEKLTAQLNSSLQSDPRIRAGVQRAWDKASAANKISQDPPVWLRTTPLSVAIARPQAAADRISFMLSATVLTDILFTKSKPTSSTTALPDLRNTEPQAGSFDIALPVSARLADIRPSNEQASAISFRTQYGTFTFKNFALSSGNGLLLIAADMTASPARLGRPIKARVTLVGAPQLDMDKGELRVRNLSYTISTRNALLQTADWLTEPLIAQELQKRATFRFAEGREDILRRANAKLTTTLGKLPPGVKANLSVASLEVSDVTAEQGWLVLLVTASGPAALELDVTDNLLGVQ